MTLNNPAGVKTTPSRRPRYHILTFTFEALPDEPPQHLPAVIAERRRLVGVDVQGVRSDLEVLGRGES